MLLMVIVGWFTIDHDDGVSLDRRYPPLMNTEPWPMLNTSVT